MREQGREILNLVEFRREPNFQLELCLIRPSFTTLGPSVANMPILAVKFKAPLARAQGVRRFQSTLFAGISEH